MVEFKCTNQFFLHAEVFTVHNTEFSLDIERFLQGMYSSKKIPLQKKGKGILLELSAKVSENTIISIFIGNK